MTEVLIAMYEKHGQKPNAQDVIAEELGVSQPTLSQWIKYLRLQRKTILLRPDEQGGDVLQAS